MQIPDFDETPINVYRHKINDRVSSYFSEWDTLVTIIWIFLEISGGNGYGRII